MSPASLLTSWLHGLFFGYTVVYWLGEIDIIGKDSYLYVDNTVAWFYLITVTTLLIQHLSKKYLINQTTRRFRQQARHLLLQEAQKIEPSDYPTVLPSLFREEIEKTALKTSKNINQLQTGILGIGIFLLSILGVVTPFIVIVCSLFFLWVKYILSALTPIDSKTHIAVVEALVSVVMNLDLKPT